MAKLKWQKMSTAETLQMIQADDEAPLIAVDSSSDDEDLFVAEGISDDSDPDYRLPTSERFVKYVLLSFTYCVGIKLRCCYNVISVKRPIF